MSLEQELSIDKFALDEEWLSQSILIHKWSINYAQALLEKDRAKQKLELVKAETDLAVRKNPNKFGLEKATEIAVGTVIVTIPNYQTALKEYQEAEHNVNVLYGAIQAINHKKSALDNLTRLFLSGYWAEAKKAPAEMRERMEKKVQTEQEQGLAQNPRLKKLVRKI